MKPLVEKILKSGLVDKHTALLMEKWGSLESGASNLVGKEDLREASLGALIKFAEEIEELVESERSKLLETRLSMQTGEPVLGFIKDSFGETAIVLFRDEMGNFIFPPMGAVEVGTWFRLSNGGEYTIVDVVPLHQGETLVAKQVTAQILRAG